MLKKPSCPWSQAEDITNVGSDRLLMRYIMPLSEIVTDFYDQIKVSVRCVCWDPLLNPLRCLNPSFRCLGFDVGLRFLRLRGARLLGLKPRQGRELI